MEKTRFYITVEYNKSYPSDTIYYNFNNNEFDSRQGFVDEQNFTTDEKLAIKTFDDLDEEWATFELHKEILTFDSDNDVIDIKDTLLKKRV